MNLNELIRGEISALETYNQVLKSVSGEPGIEKILEIKGDHAKAVDLLRDYARKEGEVPDNSSGPWGVWAKMVTGTAKLLGDKTALMALKEGEEHGIKEYQEAIAEPQISLEVKDIIKTDLLPKQYEHVKEIDRILALI